MMSDDTQEKPPYGAYPSLGTDETVSEHGSHPPEHYPRRRGLVAIYYNPITQVCLLAFVCFMCPGLFNALNGLGGGGQVDTSTAANANSALYSTFAFFAFFSG